MINRVALKSGSKRRGVAERIAKALYAYAGRTGRTVGHGTLRKGMAALPAGLVGRITDALCRQFVANAGTQPSRSELHRLAFLYGVFPRDPNLIVLTFRVNVYPETNRTAIEHLLARLKPSMDRRDDLTLLRLFYTHKTATAGFDPQQFQRVDFAAIRHDGILADIWRVLYIKLVMEKLEFIGEFDKSTVGKYIEIESDPNITYTILHVIFDRFNRVNDLHALADVIASVKIRHSAENFAISYFFLVSFGFTAQAQALGQAHTDLPNAYRHPMYIKGVLAPRPVSAIPDVRGDDDPIDPGYADLSWAWRDAELQKAEIRARLARQSRVASGAPAKPHLLVAFFGQMRFPDDTLPGVRDWIMKDFSAHAGDVDLTFAVSTWRETGGKVFLPDDHIDTIGGFLSPRVVELLKSKGCCTISDVSLYCPRVVNKITDQRQLKTEVEESHLACYFASETYFDIGTEANYMSALGRTISDEFNGNKMLMNQGRMISRIGSVGRILEAVDRLIAPPTHVLFVRPDLCDVTGSLATVFGQMRSRSHWAVVDEDAYAQAVEGVGDRFILADRSAAREIVGIEAYTTRIFSDDAHEKTLRRKRLEPHQMLRSVLFEGAVDIVTVSRHRVGWNLFRGGVNQETILAELRVDVADMADADLKKAFAACI